MGQGTDLASTGGTHVIDITGSEQNLAFDDVRERYRVAHLRFDEFLGRARSAGKSDTIPPSFNDEWGEVRAELEEAESAISKIVDTILGSR